MKTKGTEWESRNMEFFTILIYVTILPFVLILSGGIAFVLTVAIYYLLLEELTKDKSEQIEDENEGDFEDKFEIRETE